MSEVKKDSVKKQIRDIKKTWRAGGPYAHNMVQLSLQILAKTDKEAADRTYKEIQEMGY